MLTLREFRKAMEGMPDDTPIEIQVWAEDPEDFDGVPDDVAFYERSVGHVIMIQCNSNDEEGA